MTVRSVIRTQKLQPQQRQKKQMLRAKIMASKTETSLNTTSSQKDSCRFTGLNRKADPKYFHLTLHDSFLIDLLNNNHLFFPNIFRAYYPSDFCFFCFLGLVWNGVVFIEGVRTIRFSQGARSWGICEFGGGERAFWVVSVLKRCVGGPTAPRFWMESRCG